MTLPSDFRFSQGSLQAYVDCPRRFHLQFVEQVQWPAVAAEPALDHERWMEQGRAFHRLAHQHTLGIAPGTIEGEANADLRRWWYNFRERGLQGLPETQYAEVELSAPLAAYRLVAKYDLVAVELGERGVIADWKTSRRPPSRAWLADRLQTRVYPYLLVRAGAELNGGQPFRPGQVEMAYWTADFPDQVERFSYDAEQYAADEAFLAALVEEIAGLDEGGFGMRADERHCRYCRYRSLCGQGTEAGPLEELSGDAGEEDLGLDLLPGLDQIAEIEY